MEPTSNYSANVAHNISNQDPSLDSAHYIANDKFLQDILKFISPAAILTNNPSLMEFFISGTRIRILNYTKINLSFDDKLNLFANNKKIAVLRTENCHLVAYHVKGHPEAICIDNKKDCMETPRSRIIVTSDGNEIDFYRNLDYENLLATPGITPREEDAFLTTDPTMIDLLREIDSHAIRDTTNLAVYHARMDPRVQNSNGYRFTVLNYTKEKITFDIKRNLRINGKLESIYGPYTPDDCQIVAYRLKDFPKFINLLVKDEGKTGMQKFSYYPSWKNISSQNRLDSLSNSKRSHEKQNFFTQSMERFRKPLNSKVKFSPRLNEILKDNPHFLQLSREISPDFMEIFQPTIIQNYCLDKCIRILNLTHQLLSFNESHEFQVNGLPVNKDKSVSTKFSNTNNLHIIAYKVPQNPDIVCLEFKKDDITFPEERHFLKRSECFKFYELISASSFPLETSERSLFAIQPQPHESNTALMTAKNIIRLMRQIPLNVIQNRSASLAIYPSRLGNGLMDFRPEFKIINFSNHEVTIDVCKHLWIDDYQKKFDNVDSIIFAFHPENNHEILCLKTDSSVSYFEKGWDNFYFPQNEYKRKFHMVFLERAYNYLWKAQYNIKSRFSQLPKELIQQIAINYIQILNRSLKFID